MTERPIIFNDAMSLAVIEGRKTVTRRPLALPEFRKSDTPGYDWTWRGQAPIRSIAQQQRRPGGCWQDVTNARLLSLCPFGVPGDKLWVREAWRTEHFGTSVEYRAGCGAKWFDAMMMKTSDYDDAVRWSKKLAGGKWAPSIHMPRWASRTVLDVLDVRVERLQSMTEEDARAEGFEQRKYAMGLDANLGLAPSPELALPGFVDTWNAIYPAMPFHANPWVWRIEFKGAGSLQ